VAKIVLKDPSDSIYQQRDHRFAAQRSLWRTSHRFALPQGESAKPLAGRWRVEVFLDGAPVGQRDFIFDAGSIRLKTDARLRIAHGKSDAEAPPGGWHWTNRYAAMENIRSAQAVLGVALEDELSRRFPRVDAVAAGEPTGDATVLLTTNLAISPNPAFDSRLELEVTHLPSKAVRKYLFKTSAGDESTLDSGTRHFGVDAADLALQAASNPAVLDFLITSTGAVPE
jgi:hypothetical protein